MQGYMEYIIINHQALDKNNGALTVFFFLYIHIKIYSHLQGTTSVIRKSRATV